MTYFIFSFSFFFMAFFGQKNHGFNYCHMFTIVIDCWLSFLPLLSLHCPLGMVLWTEIKSKNPEPPEAPSCKPEVVHGRALCCLSSDSCCWSLLHIYICRGAVWGVEGSRFEAWMKSHKSEVACYNITFICTPTRKQCRLSPEMNTWTPAASANKQPASAGTLGEKGRCRPSAQVLTL